MQETIDKLLGIEIHDHKISDHKKTIRELVKVFDRSSNSYKKSKKDFSVIDQLFSGLNKQIKECETLAKIETENKKEIEEKMLQVKNQKEYMALKKEIDTTVRIVNEMEDMTLELEGKKEEQNSEYDDLKSSFEEHKTEFDINKVKLEKNQTKIKKKIALLEKENNKSLTSLDKKYMKQYTRLQKGSFIPAIVKIHNEICNGCRTAIPWQDFNQILKSKIGECIHCHRILVYESIEDIEEDEKSKKVGS